ncbi:hypothetical protein [Myxococcus eversor]|uniref:hypothetical protein n=1 Tax=Myxococcus eversor TaxID=2709661 RepID=UPI0013D6B14C|nr:hypothetical protein [Myxococcus eversor]
MTTTTNWFWIGAVLLAAALSYGVSRLANPGEELAPWDAAELHRMKVRLRELEASTASSARLAHEAQAAALAAQSVGPSVDARIAPAKPLESLRAPDAGDSTEGTSAAPTEVTPGDVVARLDARFFSEGVDPAWSRDAARRVERIGTHLPQGARIVALECRSSMCRLEMSHPSQNAFQHFIHAGLVDDAYAWDGPFMAAITGTPDQAGNVEAVAYLAKPDTILTPSGTD